MKRALASNKSPIFYEKSPIFYEKSPIFYEKSPPYIILKEELQLTDSPWPVCSKKFYFLRYEPYIW